jgi:hypothetical protein
MVVHDHVPRLQFSYRALLRRAVVSHHTLYEVVRHRHDFDGILGQT